MLRALDECVASYWLDDGEGLPFRFAANHRPAASRDAEWRHAAAAAAAAAAVGTMPFMSGPRLEALQALDVKLNHTNNYVR
jgi:hypothetical protein